MAIGTPLNFVHLFERMSEPFGFGLRGNGKGGQSSMTYFYYEDHKMMNEMVESDTMKETLKMIQSRMTQPQMRQQGVKMVPIPSMPKQMPDLKLVNHLCPKTGNFCYFLPTHKQAFSMLKEIFMKQANPDELFRMACACRDNPMINTQLFVYALSSCLVSRRDTRHIRIPSHYEIMPASYCGIDVVRQANKMAHMPEMPNGSSKKPVVMVDQNLTGKGADPEQRMWYFREDILVNSHHFHWHIVFPTCSPKDPTKEGYRDRRGELFYYMHHSMIARYDTERLCNGLPRANKFNFGNLVLEEGYFGKLSSENSNQHWGTRQAFTRLTDVRRVRNDDGGLQIRVEELERMRDRILESIDLGYYVQKDKVTKKDTRVHLDEIKGIDVLGDILESSATLTPHPQYYGEIGFHNLGHVLIAFSHDPAAKHKEKAGVMGDVSSAMRDPAFYRWHKYIDDLFDKYKKTLPPYPLNQKDNSLCLRWNSVEVVPQSFYVKAKDSGQVNILKTFWDMKDVDLARGLDFRRDYTTGMHKTPVTGRFAHLNHGPFEYFLKIKNTTRNPVLATIRIFMAPKHDENGDPFSLDEQRLLFFEMDKVPHRLQPGVNDIRLSSTNSSVTLRDENGSSFKQIEEIYREAKDMKDVVNESQCSCGWPQHLLLPKGTTGGMEFDLFVIVTDGSQDMVKLDKSKGCNSAFSFCGVLGEKYPDARPMGFPFDRLPYSINNKETPKDLAEICYADMIQVPTLEMYVGDIKNSATVKVTIFHENIMKKDPGMMNEQVMSPDGRCVRMTDFYSMENGNNQPPRNPGEWYNNGNKGSTIRPSRLNQQQQQERDEFDQTQWGGIGHGRYSQRQSREPDDDWEHLGGGYN